MNSIYEALFSELKALCLEPIIHPHHIRTSAGDLHVESQLP